MRRVVLGLVGALAGCRGETPPSGDDAGAGQLVYELFFRPESSGPGVLEYLELAELGPEHRGRRVKLRGFVADAPIERTPDGARHRFVVEGGATTLVVEHGGTLPNRFQPKLEVILTGTISDDGTRIATDELVAKCPETYDDGTKAPR